MYYFCSLFPLKDVSIDTLEELGYTIFDEYELEFDLRDYVIDSMKFLQFIVAIEDKIGVELPDDFLLYDCISSIDGFSNKLFEFINETKN